MKQTKKLLSLFLSVVMLLSVTVGLDLSAYGATSGDFEYTLLDDGTAEIMGYVGTETNVVFPLEIDGYIVTSISNINNETISEMTIPYTVTEIAGGGHGAPFYDCKNLISINVDANNKNYSSQDGVLFNKEKTELIQYPIGNTRTTYKVPEGVRDIFQLAFYGCVYIENIELPGTLESIWQGAFRNCISLKRVHFSNNTRAIGPSVGDSAFYNCKSLETINLPDGIDCIGYNTFRSCENLSNINIPDSVTVICTNAFKDCINLTSIVIGNSVKDIGYDTFLNCEKLKDVYYSGTESEWANISISDYGNDSLLNANIHFNYKEPCKTHTYKTTITKATTSKNGSVVTKCTVCGNVSKNTTIYYPKTITLSKTSYTYNGKAQKPNVTVKDSKGNKIASSNYTVTYQSGRKNVGKYTVTIKFKGNYSGTVKKIFTIKPKSTSISKLTAGKKKFTVKWKKLTTQTTGYQIQYSTSSKFSNTKTVTVSKNSTTSKTISKLSAKKKYYVRIRAYKTVNGKKYYSVWSKAKSVTTKK